MDNVTIPAVTKSTYTTVNVEMPEILIQSFREDSHYQIIMRDNFRSIQLTAPELSQLLVMLLALQKEGLIE
jgi:hypothetical protein